MKEKRGFIGLVSLISVFCLVAVAGAADFSGTYVYKTPKATVTLTLSQDQQGKLSGLLSSTTGAKFQVIGHSKGNVARGECRVGNKGAAPFVAHLDENILLFTIINGKNKQNTVIKFSPVKKSQPRAEVSPRTPTPPPNENGHGTLQFGKPQKPMKPQRPKNTGSPLLGKWICRTTNGNFLLHFISENQLTFNGEAARYTATADRIMVQADGQILTYPYVFTKQGLIITFPNGVKALFVKLSKGDQAQTASARGKIFPELVGRWKDIRSSGNTIIVLTSDGHYNYYSDYTAGNSAQGQTNWGYGNSATDRGTWRAQGTPAAGTIYYTSQDGSSDTLSYQVHVENGQTYWREYYFDGKLYVKQ